MSAFHVPWSSIELLHNVVITLTHLNKLGQRPFQAVKYRAKVKLHGKNTAVQVTDDGLVAQSRTDILSATNDLNGFAKWVAANERQFNELARDIVVFGEWAGPGVEKGMAISQLPSKIFAIFSVQVGRDESAHVVYDPEEITKLVLPILQCPGVHVLPWEDIEEIVIDYGNKAQMEKQVDVLNHLVERVEQEDPWVKRTFGASGLGEGLVFYPVSEPVPVSPSQLALLMFKAKGEKHRTAGAKVAVQVDPTVVATSAEFVELMVTNARLEQGVSQVCGGEYDIRNTGKLLQWVVSDVQKESTAELNAAGLEWKQVAGAVQTRAREWYKKRCSQPAGTAEH